MVYLLAPLVKTAYTIRKVIWSITRPLTLGVHAIVLDQEDRVLLVKHTYKSGWSLPGGGVGRGETIFQAIKRELLEEVGVSANISVNDLRGIFYNPIDYKSDHVALFVVKNWTRAVDKYDVLEISEVAFFEKSQLPLDVTKGAKSQLHAYYEDLEVGEYWRSDTLIR